MPNLKDLHLGKNIQLKSLIGCPSAMEELRVFNCDIASLDGLSDLKRLDFITVSDNPRLESLEGLPGSIKYLFVASMKMKSLESLPAHVKTLTKLTIKTTDELVSLKGCPSTRILNVTDCSRLTDLAGLPAGIRILDLSGCTGLTVESLKDLPPSLDSLTIARCEKLVDGCDLPFDKVLEISAAAGFSTPLDM